jgi:transcription elongation factor Elf1
MKNKQSAKLYQFYCEICNWKKITDGSGTQELVEAKTSPIPRGIPKRDPETGKVTTSKPIKQRRRFKCPQCGRLVFAKLLSGTPQTQTEEPIGSFMEDQEELLKNIIDRLDQAYGEQDNSA